MTACKYQSVVAEVYCYKQGTRTDNMGRYFMLTLSVLIPVQCRDVKTGCCTYHGTVLG